ncbi:type VI secretion system baseplate subunit TssG [Massilia atriviolacea]|uniref:Type VI secretion system baseplate subunit TssG n=1 Tax=Massilia atriviolacea TaxID=2495579 RepID=A0A430HS74_9BURK|nr:type VI secretion system baseplate subunit TssG [Massilia atriviolacea]RSZ60370.1 type VI secretion system baseplate subunit TssG [Massilia atriviolacea]
MNAAWTDQAPWRQLREAPYEHDLFALLRWIDARAGAAQPLGRSTHPSGEPVRLAQKASLAFAPASVAGLRERDGRPPQLSMYGFGLFGPNGPLPLHLTEYVRERERMAADPTLAAFADLFHHRLATLFYRAWADCQASASLDRPGEARFDAHLASLLGMGLPAQQRPGAIGLHARYCQAGHLGRQSRNPEGLRAILHSYFAIPVEVVEHVTHWVGLDEADRLALGRAGMGLGRGGTLGMAVRDAQSRFRLVLGPLTLDQYRRFLPGGEHVAALVEWVHEFVGMDLSWDVQLLLAEDQKPMAALSRMQPLGLSSWLGKRPADTRRAASAHLIIDYMARACGKRAAPRANAHLQRGTLHV